MFSRRPSISIFETTESETAIPWEIRGADAAIEVEGTVTGVGNVRMGESDKLCASARCEAPLVGPSSGRTAREFTWSSMDEGLCVPEVFRVSLSSGMKWVTSWEDALAGGVNTVKGRGRG